MQLCALACSSRLQVVQHTEERGAGLRTPDGGCLALVLRTGFGTEQARNRVAPCSLRWPVSRLPGAKHTLGADRAS